MNEKLASEIEALWHQEIMGTWQPGTAGNADLVRYDGDDIVGIARFENHERIKLVSLLYNNAREIIAALRERALPEGELAQCLIP